MKLFKHEEKVSLPDGVRLKRATGPSFDKKKMEVLAIREDGVLLGKAISSDLRAVHGRKSFEREIQEDLHTQRSKDIRANREIIEEVRTFDRFNPDKSKYEVQILGTNGYSGEYLGAEIEEEDDILIKSSPLSIKGEKKEWIQFDFGWVKKSKIESLEWEIDPRGLSPRKLIRVHYIGEVMESVEEESIPSPNEILLRVTGYQRAAYEAEAQRNDESLEGWICRHLNNAAGIIPQ